MKEDLIKKKISLENDSETATYLLSKEKDEVTPMIKRKLARRTNITAIVINIIASQNRNILVIITVYKTIT